MDRRRPGHPGGRRAQPVSALRVPGEDSALFDSTLQHLTERRLVTLSADDEPVVDLGHEAMITHWPALGDWIEQSRASELKRRQIERDLVPAGSTAFRGGADKQGIEQLIGNAREWTATRADTNAAGAILLRGN